MSVKLLQANERPTLSSQVARYLLDLISRQRLRPGDHVPSEVQICRDLQVSRGSVREAYRTLAALGILEIETGKRPRLQPMSAHVLSQVFGYALTTAQVRGSDVIQLRRAIEVQVAQLAALNATDLQKMQLKGYIDQMRQSVERADHRLRMVADMAFHTTLAEASGNPLNELLLAALRAPLEKVMHLDLGDRRSQVELVRIVDAHQLIVERVCAGDPVGAGAAMACHFDLSMASLPISDEELFAESAAPALTLAERMDRT